MEVFAANVHLVSICIHSSNIRIGLCVCCKVCGSARWLRIIVHCILYSTCVSTADVCAKRCEDQLLATFNHARDIHTWTLIARSSQFAICCHTSCAPVSHSHPILLQQKIKCGGSC